MKFLFVADPFSRLHPTTDTSLALLRASLHRKHKVYWATGADVSLVETQVRVTARSCLRCDADAVPEAGPAEDRALKDFDVVWIRKDPPFDDSYVALCWLLRLEEHRVAMINTPSLLLQHHEKMIPFEAVSQGFLKPADVVATHIGPDAAAKAYVEKLGTQWAVRKPFFGFGGSAIHRFAPKSEPFPASEELQLTQAYLPEVTTQGDRRVFYLKGKYLGDFVRLPKPGGYVSNLAQGGSASLAPLSAAQRAVIDRLGKYLRKSGIVFAGADLIGRRISEVNITSPTGLRAYASLTGKDLSEKFVDYAERLAE